MKDLMDKLKLYEAKHEYDEKEGVAKISKKDFAKLPKDYKGSDPKKPTMLMLTKKGTSLVPVKFTEELDEGNDMTELDELQHILRLSGQNKLSEAPLSDDARELMIYAENDADLYRQSAVPIMKNLSRKHNKGMYDNAKGQKLWKYHADRAAKKYGMEHSVGDGLKIFPPSVRMEMAREMESDWFSEMEAGNYMEGYENEPDESYGSTEDQLALSGGLNGPKTMHPTAAGGDNALAVRPVKVDEEKTYKGLLAKYMEYRELDETRNKKYNKDEVDKAIRMDPRIKGREAKAIHRLLKGRSLPSKKED